MIGPWVVLHKGGKAVEIVGPEALVAVEPIHRVLHRFRGEPARHDAAGLFAGDEAGVQQHIEMLHDRGQGHRKGFGEFANGNRIALGKTREQRPPRRIGKRGKGAIQDFISILNHVV
jgi:hypothetical protein